MRLQPIYDIAELCSQKGITQTVLCPGSRCAPLTLAFARHPRINTRSFSDERSAGFIALGMAQSSKVPTVLICTSGSAAYNFAPSVAEAFFNQIPLIVFSADRPSEWIAQQDGQTIYQTDLFGKHVKNSFQLPQEYEHPDNTWAINRIINEAINLSRQEPQGPVHINAPFREPLYPSKDESITFAENLRVIEEHTTSFEISTQQKQEIINEWPSFNRILIVAGQGDVDADQIELLISFTQKHKVPIAGDILSNLHPIEMLIRHTDLFLGQAPDTVKKTLQPDLLITFGKSVLSKNLKVFLRNYAPKQHWHIQEAGVVADTFQHVTHVFRTKPESFFHYLNTIPQSEGFSNQKQNNYNKLWEVEERRALRALDGFFPQTNFGEFEMIHEIMQTLPANSSLHLANSMSVRYANFIGLKTGNTVNVFSNRGTSGIDGCSSTTVGHSLMNTNLTFLITGDLAFFYDRNAFWHNYPLPNLRIVVINNHGGIIFKMIDGPGSLPESDEYFATQQKLNARKLCEEFGFDYLRLDNKRKLKNLLKDFFEPDGKTKVLELESEATLNKSIFENLKQKIKESYEL